DWLKVRLSLGPNFQELKQIMRTQELHTVCEEAMCPNIGECWEQRTATFMILGNVCTRACRYCNVTSGRPSAPPDPEEPDRVAEAAARMGLKHVVVTSVQRDDVADGGASLFVATIERLRARIPSCSVEVLIPDFDGNPAAIDAVIDARPDILNHNIEAVREVFPRVRPKGSYDGSLRLLERAAERGGPNLLTKSGLIVGLGETRDQIVETLRDLRDHRVRIVTIGQYLRPTAYHTPVQRWVTPEEFAELKATGEDLGIDHVESGPLVRSSYHARQQVESLRSTESAPIQG
ncbi:MAG TPA: lipoyl synthase, partial [Dehalococcoidia bacterium]|nr:lipoyl synthase [Dehalococcoidia bacterium]